jgi:hypothetical protein
MILSILNLIDDVKCFETVRSLAFARAQVPSECALSTRLPESDQSL